MKPLSILKYYQNNRKRFLSVLISVTLSVILLYIVQMVIYSSFRLGHHLYTEPRKYFSTISPKGEVLNRSIITTIEHTEGVGRVIPCVFDSTSVRAGIGSNYAAMIYSIEPEEITKMMELLDLKLESGRLPEAGNEIVLHKQVAANKGLKIGDIIGRMVSKEETLPGVYHIVGILEGKHILSFAPIKQYINTYHLPYEYIYGGIIFPESGALDEMNQALESMVPSNYQINTINTEKAWLKNSEAKVELFITLVCTFIIIIVSSCIGFLCYIYFTQRRSEFGLLWAIGYSRQKVINRAFAEINGINLLGFALGILLSILTGIILNITYFKPIGDSLEIINLRYILGAACSPLFVTLFSLIPVWRMLKKLDPISIIDGSML